MFIAYFKAYFENFINKDVKNTSSGNEPPLTVLMI